jgi:hypothetical protein
MLQTSLEQLAYIVEKAREFDEETEPVDADSGSNPSNDRGDFEAGEWHEVLTQARDARDELEIQHLMGTPLLADYLEAAMRSVTHSMTSRAGYSDKPQYLVLPPGMKKRRAGYGIILAAEGNAAAGPCSDRQSDNDQKRVPPGV